MLKQTVAVLALLTAGVVLSPGPVRAAQAAGEKNKVVIVEWSDFQCPYCQKAYGVIQKLFDKYGDQIELDYRHFPLDFHPAAVPAAAISECARDQGSFMEVHNAFFAMDSRSMNEDALLRAAKSKVKDPAGLEQCYRSGKKDELVRQDMAEGQAAGVTGTPGFLIEGRVISGAQPFEVFDRLISVLLDPEKATKMFVVTPPNCADCAPDELIGQLVGDLLQGVVPRNVSLDSPKGQELNAIFDFSAVPAIVLEKGVTEEPNFGRVQRHFTQREGYFQLSNDAVQPTLYLKPLPNYAFDLSLGPKDAPVTIIEYTDFTADRSAAVSQAVIEAIKRYPGKIRHIVRPAPGQKLETSRRMGRAAYCLAEQGKFWKGYPLLSLLGTDPDSRALGRAAGHTGVEGAAVTQCLENQERFTARESAYEKDVASLSLKPGVSLFVGRQRLEDPNLDSLTQAVEGLLSARNRQGKTP